MNCSYTHTHRWERVWVRAPVLPNQCACLYVCGLCCSAYCEVAQCALRSGQTPPELKSFSSLAGFQAAPRDAGQCFRQGDTHPVPSTPLYPLFLCPTSTTHPLLCPAVIKCSYDAMVQRMDIFLFFFFSGLAAHNVNIYSQRCHFCHGRLLTLTPKSWSGRLF